jgi:hypothetical protein
MQRRELPKDNINMMLSNSSLSSTNTIELKRSEPLGFVRIFSTAHIPRYYRKEQQRK